MAALFLAVEVSPLLCVVVELISLERRIHSLVFGGTSRPAIASPDRSPAAALFGLLNCSISCVERSSAVRAAAAAAEYALKYRGFPGLPLPLPLLLLLLSLALSPLYT